MPPIPRRLAILAKATQRALTDWDAPGVRLLTTSLLIYEAVLNALLIRFVAYTEIDWTAYMQQVRAFVGGQRDYAEIRGDTGPLVYPAGHVYAFTALHELTAGGRDIIRAQILFAVLYIATIAVVHEIYRRSRVAPPYTLILLSLSKRFHSIFVLRLFNDPVAMLLAWCAILALQRGRFVAATVLYSLGVAVKMNVLLMLPAFGLVLWKYNSTLRTAALMTGAVMIQILLALPFLIAHPHSYLSRAFEFSRVFLYRWTVNWKMLPESTFTSQAWSMALLCMLILLLLFFADRRFLRVDGGLLPFIQRRLRRSAMNSAAGTDIVDPSFIATVFFTTNFLGVVTARSLHYQFYSWYFPSIPYLLWLMPRWPGERWPLLQLVLFFGIEYCWNVYPSTAASSGLLLACHVVMVVGLWRRKTPTSAKRLRKKRLPKQE